MIKNRPNLYDRLSADRIAKEKAAQAAQLEAAALEAERQAAPVPPAALQNASSCFTFGGFQLEFPDGFRFRDIQTTLEHDGELVTLTIRRRDVRQGQTLEQLFDDSLQSLLRINPQVRFVRRSDASLAGNPAKAQDFQFTTDHEQRHGRLVGALVPVAGRDYPQWLEISCAIDPAKAGLSQWLLQFDRMLDGLMVR